MQGVLIIFHAMTWRVLLSVLLLIACGFAQQNKPTPAEVQVVHHAVMIDGAKYDAIITRPASSGRHPAVFLIGGLGCYSLADIQPGEPYYELLHGLSRAGFVTMRVDKNGQGASQGPACDSPESDLHLAVRRGVAGLNALAGLDYVDRQQIFVFAHSIGPFEGVLAVQQFPVRGFVAAETIGKTWYEYELENVRRQMALLSKPFDDIDRRVRTSAKCKYQFLIEKQKPEHITASSPECASSVQTFGVAYTYLQQIADVNIAAEWKKVDVPVLVTLGTSDPATTAEESQYLVTVINSFHPGRAIYAEFRGMGHELDMADSPLAWLKTMQTGGHGPFDKEFLERVIAWLESVRQQTPKATSHGHEPSVRPSVLLQKRGTMGSGQNRA